MYSIMLPQTSQVYIIAALVFSLFVSRCIKLIVVELKNVSIRFFTIRVICFTALSFYTMSPVIKQTQPRKTMGLCAMFRSLISGLWWRECHKHHNKETAPSGFHCASVLRIHCVFLIAGVLFLFLLFFDHRYNIPCPAARVGFKTTQNLSIGSTDVTNLERVTHQ